MGRVRASEGGSAPHLLNGNYVPEVASHLEGPSHSGGSVGKGGDAAGENHEGGRRGAGLLGEVGEGADVGRRIGVVGGDDALSVAGVAQVGTVGGQDVTGRRATISMSGEPERNAGQTRPHARDAPISARQRGNEALVVVQSDRTDGQYMHRPVLPLREAL